MIEINGKVYPLWSQFVEKKDEWIGGDLEDFGDLVDRRMFNNYPGKTIIEDITLRENGSESAFFEIIGKDFTCGGDVSCLGISGKDGNEEGWLPFNGYGGHEFRIRKPVC